MDNMRPWQNSLNALANYDWGASKLALEKELYFKGQEMQRQKVADMLAQFESQAKINPESAIQRLMNPSDPITQYAGRVQPQSQYSFGGKEYDISSNGTVTPYNQYKPLMSELKKVSGLLDTRKLWEQGKADFDAQRKAEVDKQNALNSTITETVPAPLLAQTLPNDIDRIGGAIVPEVLSSNGSTMQVPMSKEQLAKLDLETASKFQPETAQALSDTESALKQAESMYSPEQMDYYSGLIKAYPNITKMSPKQVETIVTAYDKRRMDSKPDVTTLADGTQLIKVVDNNGNTKWQQVKEPSGEKLHEFTKLFASTKGIDISDIQQELKKSKELQKEHDAKVTEWLKKGNISVSMGSKAFEDKLAESDVKDIQEVRGATRISSEKLSTYKKLVELSKEVYTGTGGEAVSTLQRIATSLGFKVAGMGKAEVLKSVASGLLAQNKQLLPGPMSNPDREFLLAMEASLDSSPDAIERLYQIAQKTHERTSKLSEMVDNALLAGKGTRDIGVMISRFYANPDAFMKSSTYSGSGRSGTSNTPSGGGIPKKKR